MKSCCEAALAPIQLSFWALSTPGMPISAAPVASPPSMARRER